MSETDVKPSVQHLGDLIWCEGVEVRGGVRAMHAGDVFALQGARRAPLGLDGPLTKARARDGSDLPVI